MYTLLIYYIVYFHIGDIYQVLEEIDDDLDQFGIMFVKIDDEKEADEYGIENLPAIGESVFKIYMKNICRQRINMAKSQHLFLCLVM